jgi:sigma-E factor negative regulatory protein RseC
MAGGKAEVVAEKKGGCASCASAASCHSSHSAMKMKSTVINGVAARPGDTVAIDVSTNSLLKGLALIYLLPVLGLMSGAIMGSNMAEGMTLSQTGGAILCGGIGLTGGFTAVFLISKFMALNDAYTPVINRIIKKGSDAPAIIGALKPVAEDCPCREM